MLSFFSNEDSFLQLFDHLSNRIELDCLAIELHFPEKHGSSSISDD